MPVLAEAGFFNSIFGNEVSASITSQDASINNNSQTMALLEVSTSSASLLSKNESSDEEDADLNNIVSDNALLPATSPLGVSDGEDDSFIGGPASEQVSVYVVRPGDSLSQIAEMFDVSVNTILWANDMKKSDTIAPGDVLFILPVSGLEHTVTKGQTLAGIAKLYKVEALDIASYNDIAENAALAVGDKLIIPNAEKGEESDKPIKNLSASIAKDNQYYKTHPVQNLSGYYVNPVPGARKSQGIHDKNGVDLAIGKGTPIYAAASGRVILARNGYNGGFGNLVIISHPNGTETLYAHQSKIAVSTGAQVSQGQVIGYVGSTGRSTGPHLHFEVHGARNPGADGSWAR